MGKNLCYVYVNTASYLGGVVCKIGISNNIEKRIREFNTGLRCRARYYNDITGVEFKNAYKKPMDRLIAKLVEKECHKKIKDKLIKEMGNEVFDIDPKTAISLLRKTIKEVVA